MSSRYCCHSESKASRVYGVADGRGVALGPAVAVGVGVADGRLVAVADGVTATGAVVEVAVDWAARVASIVAVGAGVGVPLAKKPKPSSMARWTSASLTTMPRRSASRRTSLARIRFC